MFQMCGVFAEFERGMIRERVNAGLARARAKGKRLGRPPVAPSIEAKIREPRKASAKSGSRRRSASAPWPTLPQHPHHKMSATSIARFGESAALRDNRRTNRAQQNHLDGSAHQLKLSINRM